MNKVLKIVFIVVGCIGTIFAFIILLGFIIDKREDIRFDREIMEEFSDIEYSIPNEFKKYGSYHNYNYYGSGESCRFSAYASKKYNEDFENWFKGTILTNLNDEVGDLTTINLNGKETLFVEIKSNDNTEHHYGFRSPNYYYHIEYTISNPKSNKCNMFEDEILKSIKIKE